MSHAAELSIVVVALNLLQVKACVESLAACRALDRAEILLVSTLDCTPLKAICPRLRMVAAAPEWALPRQRAEGLRQTSGTWTAVLSEDYRVTDGWASAALSQPEQADVLVGEVVPPEKGAFAVAAYLWEYLHVAPPAATGKLTGDQARWAPAGAVVYRMAGLDIDLIGASRSEMDYHAALAAAGRSFFRDPRMQVRYAPPVHGFLADRMRRSREWARSRSASKPLTLRSLAGLSRTVLPILLIGRFIARAAVRPSYWLRALRALPFVLLFASAEALGEIDGYLRRPV